MNEVNFKNFSWMIILFLVLISIAGIVTYHSVSDNSSIFTQINNPDLKNK